MHDIWYCNASDINDYMMYLQPQVTQDLANGIGTKYFSTYGDRIYVQQECISRAHKAPVGGALTQHQLDENDAMKGCREPVEWTFGALVNMFGIFQTYMIHWKLLSKGRQNNDIPFKQYMVCCLLYNCRVCASGGNNVSVFFDSKPPTLDEYLAFL